MQIILLTYLGIILDKEQKKFFFFQFFTKFHCPLPLIEASAEHLMQKILAAQFVAVIVD